MVLGSLVAHSAIFLFLLMRKQTSFSLYYLIDLYYGILPPRTKNGISSFYQTDTQTVFLNWWKSFFCQGECVTIMAEDLSNGGTCFPQLYLTIQKRRTLFPPP